MFALGNENARLTISLTTLRWGLLKIDVNNAFLETGNPEPDVYLYPTQDFLFGENSFEFCLTAAYGLINA